MNKTTVFFHRWRIKAQTAFLIEYSELQQKIRWITCFILYYYKYLPESKTFLRGLRFYINLIGIWGAHF